MNLGRKNFFVFFKNFLKKPLYKLERRSYNKQAS